MRRESLHEQRLPDFLYPPGSAPRQSRGPLDTPLALAALAALATAAQPRPTGHAAGGADVEADAVIGAGPVFHEKKKKIFKGLPAPKNSYNFVD